jgi:L-iditol 2-dehydrogenase
VRAVSICGTDAHLVRGDYPGFWPPAFPFIPGHEWAGEIAALGPGAELYGWKVGDRVAGTSHDACGVCQKCVEGHYNLCENYGRAGLHKQYGHSVQGADATYVVHGVKCIFPLPDGISFDEGAVIDPASIALHVANRGNIAPGDNVAIMGAGAIGLLSGDGARIRGAARVIVIERNPGRLAKAAAMGFETIDPSAGDPVAMVREMTGGLGVDVVLECAGVPATVQLALGMLRRGGRCAAVGIPTQGVEIAMQRLVLDELELVGCRASAGEMRRVMPLVEQGRMRVREVMTHRFALADYAQALATFNDPASGAIKIIVAP